MPDFPLGDRPVFRPSPTDHDHAATIAARLRSAGAVPTPTAIIRAALSLAAGQEGDPKAASGPRFGAP